jgi:hypothetical protein
MIDIRAKLDIPIRSQCLFLIHSRNTYAENIRLDKDKTRDLTSIDFSSGQLIDLIADYNIGKNYNHN